MSKAALERKYHDTIGRVDERQIAQCPDRAEIERWVESRKPESLKRQATASPTAPVKDAPEGFVVKEL